MNNAFHDTDGLRLKVGDINAPKCELALISPIDLSKKTNGVVSNSWKPAKVAVPQNKLQSLNWWWIP